MNFCDSCVHWTFTYDGALEKFGTCNNDDVWESLKLAEADDDELDDPTVFIAATFGCIYHTKKSATKAVTEIKINK